MTNKDDNEDASSDTRLADLLAVHLVTQVLEEACIIVNNAKDSGQPWRYFISSLKKNRNHRWDETYDDELTFVVSKDDSEYENQENTVVTSTPQKIENMITKSRNEASFMGQGDEELEVRGHYDLRKSTSMFINHLFDMSNVEHVIITDTQYVMENRNSRSEQFLIETNKNNMECKQQNFQDQSNTFEVKSEENSSYSFLNDALFTETPKDYDFFKCDYDKTNDNKVLDDVQNSTSKELTCNLNETIGNMDKNDLALYENAYLTMNRDYDQNSEEDEPILQDSKVASLEEIDLITVSASKDNVISHEESTKELKAVSGVSNSGTSSRKGNIVRRCRNQGAKLLSCLSGWLWRKKLFGKRKGPRVCGSVRGLCSLSPDTRRRAASLLDHRNLSTPSPSRSVVWKFNTVNEALVHSSHWKYFDFKMNVNENDEF
ncbi:uncharacterized protein LOC125067525 [Vanessa atalanta]|uniref:uncharacterized protein LOC125067525 n=1 Tax=Vanessa atalanta TaxID=42275 RepID=UPI001FCD0D81|nr:uncharacterized protein LOC125067525 [Vanessa atalanta]